MDSAMEMNIYGGENKDRFLIKTNRESPKCFYLDDHPVTVKQAKVKSPISLKLKGGAEKKKETAAVVLYPSLSDFPDKTCREYITTCHLDYVMTNHKSNSIFIIPDDTAMKAIKADIKDKLGKVDPDSAEGVAMIKELDLLYKAFIFDTYGSVERNDGMEYRLPLQYPEEITDKVYRRTSRYNGKVFYVKLDKKGASISASKTMKDAVTVKYETSVGRLPSYISFVFKGNVLPLLKEKEKVTKKTTAKALFSHLLRKCNDAGAEHFVAACIEKHGVEACKEYYSADMVHSAFAMLAAFGCDCDMKQCDDVHAMHVEMFKAYKPTKKSNSKNKAAFQAFNDKVAFETPSSAHYFEQLRKGYGKLFKNEAVAKAQLMADMAYGIYNETDNVELATSVMEMTDNVMAPERLRSMASFFVPLHGLDAKADYPMLFAKPVTRCPICKKPSNKCTCRAKPCKCPGCGKPCDKCICKATKSKKAASDGKNEKPKETDAIVFDPIVEHTLVGGNDPDLVSDASTSEPSESTTSTDSEAEIDVVAVEQEDQDGIEESLTLEGGAKSKAKKPKAPKRK